ncbi:hypothetical protein [Pseudomonas sp. CFBP 13727]|nr:hypothetical protein [Pseudomonas sp. CFBP 13727]MBD8623892.1 hypothetical protein [Pseudomonas sp. CFBP 13727]
MNILTDISGLSSGEDINKITKGKLARLVKIGVSQLNWWRGAPMIR